MKSILLLIYANFRKRKLTNVIISIAIFIAAMLFAAASGIIMNIDKSFDKMCEELKAANLILSVNSDDYSPAELTGWWKKQAETISIAQYPTYSIPGDILVNGVKKEARVFVAERPVDQPNQDLLLFKEASFDTSSPPLFPTKGKIWVPAILSNNGIMKVGDIIGIPTAGGIVDYEISASIIDPQYNSSFGSKRMWIRPGSLYKLVSPVKSTNYTIAIRLNNTQCINKKKLEFINSREGDFNGSITTYNSIKHPYLLLYKITGMVIMVISIICLIISIFIITGNITSFILSEYRQIGIIKAVGFTPNNVKAVYLLQIAILAVSFTILGMIAGVIITRLLISYLGDSVGISAKASIMLPAVLTITIVPSLISLFAWLNTIKAGKIKPSPAIRFGLPEKEAFRKHKISLHKYTYLPVSLFLGIRNLYTVRRKMVYLVISFFLTITVTAVAFNTVKLLEDSMTDMKFWGEPDADITVTKSSVSLSGKDDFLSILKENPNIKAVTTSSNEVWAEIPALENAAPFSIIGLIYSANMDDVGLCNIAGRHPTGKFEIAVSDGLRHKYKLTIGDTIELFIKGDTRAFNIVGIIQNVQNTGYNFRITHDTYRAIKPGHQPSIYYVKLKDTTIAEDTIKEIESRFGMQADAILKSSTYNEIVGDFNSTLPNIKIMLILVSLIFFAISFIIINNDTVQYIGEYRKSFGILGSIGMTPIQLRLSSVYRILIQIFGSLILAIPVSFYLAPELLNQAFGSSGFGAFQPAMDTFSTILLFPIFGIFGLISAWIPAGRIMKIKPKELVME